MKTIEILNLKVSDLKPHPKNSRRYFNENDVREMANSILANGGVIEPIVVTGNGNGKYLVVDGNMRLAGARLLGSDCPDLECKVVDMAEAEQLLAMVTANQVRYDVDPVSEALHYKALQDRGLSVRDISKRTGVYEARIYNRIILAELEEPIQKMIACGKLPSSPPVAKALLKLTPDVRLRLAKKIAANPNTKIQTIIKACEKLAGGKDHVRLKRPAVELSKIENESGAVKIKDLREAAAKTCKVCNQTEADYGREFSWSIVAHAADETCSGCNLKDMRTICEGCPVVELLRNLKNRKGRA